MRLATLIIGLLLSFGLLIQSLIASAGGSLTSDKKLQDAAAWGLVAALLFVIASALAIAKPRFSMWTFAALAPICFIAGASTAFKDLIFWGGVATVLALMSWRGSIEKRKKDAEEANDRAILLAAAETVRRAGASPIPTP